MWEKVRLRGGQLVGEQAVGEGLEEVSRVLV